MSQIKLDAICAIAKQAGEAILEIYEGAIEVEIKADNSPLTLADRASHDVIMAGLREVTPEIPILSEEGRDIPYEERRHWQRFWLVDPLDGTKEFIKRNGEFTVNIALIEDGRPVAGVVHVPAKQTTYFADLDGGAWREVGGDLQRLTVQPPPEDQGLRVVMSRSHPSPELDAFLKTIRVAEAVPVGSSLKFCVVAEGRADVYPRFGPTMEWDTAAGHAVVAAAGGAVTEVNGPPLKYNKENLLNPYFIVTVTN